MFNSVVLKELDSTKFMITGLNGEKLRTDIRKYFGKNGPTINRAGLSMKYHIFSIVLSSFVFGSSSITFEKFFTLEVNLVFQWLYEIYGRSDYKDIVSQLNETPIMKALHAPMLEVPANALSRVNSFGVELLDYQKEFLKQYYNARHKIGLEGYVMAFEQGLGKTFTAIATVYAFNLFPCIVTAPKSTLLSWKTSIERLVPTSELREDVLAIGNKFVICNYESLNKVGTYLKSNPKAMIVDEIQNFRYLNTARTQNIIDIQSKYKIQNILALSGTPIKALASEMIPIMTMIDPMFRNSPKAQYIFKHIYSSNTYDSMASAVLKERLRLYMVKKEVKQVLNLPPKYKYSIKLNIRNITPYSLKQVMQDIHNYVNSEMSKRTKRDVILLVGQLSKILSDFPSDTFTSDDLSTYIQCVKVMGGIISSKSWHILNFIKQSKQDLSGYIYSMERIRAYEAKFKEVNPALTKELVRVRKQITSYYFILLGKAIGEFIVRGKIRLLNTAINENMDKFIKIINTSLKKVVVFSTYKEPLLTFSNNLSNYNIQSIVIENGSDFNKNFQSFANNPKQRVILGTIQAIGTGTDGIQHACNTAIFLNRPFRSTDSEQAESRIYRKGQDSSTYVYYVDIDPATPNVLSHESQINDWSKNMLSIAGV